MYSDSPFNCNFPNPRRHLRPFRAKIDSPIRVRGPRLRCKLGHSPRFHGSAVRKKKLGFWVDPSPIPPWEFRREKELAMPPAEENQMDYDLILNYGIIGDLKRKIYWWPACKDYPEKKVKNIIPDA